MAIGTKPSVPLRQRLAHCYELGRRCSSGAGSVMTNVGLGKLVNVPGNADILSTTNKKTMALGHR
jgi:hypothetical protein